MGTNLPEWNRGRGSVGVPIPPQTSESAVRATVATLPFLHPSVLGVVLMGSPSTSKGDLWDAETPQEDCCLLSARLFPVLHASEALGLEDVLWLLAPAASGDRLARWRAAWRMSWQELLPCLDKAAELGARRDLFFLQGQRKVRRVLLGRQDGSLLPLIRSAVYEGYHEALLSTLDEGKLDQSYISGLFCACCALQYP